MAKGKKKEKSNQLMAMTVDRKGHVMTRQQLCQRGEAGNLERAINNSAQLGRHLHEYTEITGNSWHVPYRKTVRNHILP